MFTNNLVSGITKTRVMSGVFAATLMAFSFSSWALNGPACNVPQPGGKPPGQRRRIMRAGIWCSAILDRVRPGLHSA